MSEDKNMSFFSDVITYVRKLKSVSSEDLQRVYCLDKKEADKIITRLYDFQIVGLEDEFGQRKIMGTLSGAVKIIKKHRW